MKLNLLSALKISLSRSETTILSREVNGILPPMVRKHRSEASSETLSLKNNGKRTISTATIATTYRSSKREWSVWTLKVAICETTTFWHSLLTLTSSSRGLCPIFGSLSRWNGEQLYRATSQTTVRTSTRWGTTLSSNGIKKRFVSKCSAMSTWIPSKCKRA